MDVHRAARLTCNGLGHECGVHIVTHRGLPHGALEKEHFISERERIGVKKVDLHLTCAELVNQRVHVQPHLAAVVVHIFKQRVEFIHGVNRIRLPGRLRATAATNRRLQWQVRIGVARDQIKLHLWRDDGEQPLSAIKLNHALEHGSRRVRNQPAFAIKTVMHNLRGRVGRPRHEAHGARVGHQMHVFIRHRNHVKVRTFGGELARHRTSNHHLGQPHAAVFSEFFAGQNFAARHAR